jgi:hypothetical protein
VSYQATLGGPNLLNKLSPSLLLNFTNTSTLDPRITFTRSTTATFTGSNGLIQTAAIDAPRFDYNPTTLASLGLLIEEQRVNLLLNTSVLGTQVVTVTAAAHTLSFYGTGTIVLSGAFTGTVTGTGAYPTRTILTFTPIVGVLTVTVTGSVTSAQLEAGAFPTSYIPTVASQVTRAADVASITGTNFTSFYNASEGTVYFESQTAQGTNSYAFSLFGTSTANRIFANYTTTNRMQSGIRVATVFEAAVNTPNNSAPLNTFGKGATAYKVNDFGFSWNGAAALTDTSTTLPVVQQLDIGNNGALATNFLNGHIRQLAYYPRRLANAELQGFSR